MRDHTLLEVNLRLFDGAAAGAGGEGPGTSGGTQASSADAGQSTANPSGGTQQKVVYGRQSQTAEPAAAGREKEAQKQTADPQEERRRAYRAMVDGEFKDLYAEDTRNIIDKRFRASLEETEALQARLNAQQPLIDALSRRYSAAGQDAELLLRALEEDDPTLEARAEKNGLTPEQQRSVDRLQRSNDAKDRQIRQLQAADAARVGRERAERQLAKWYGEAEELKQSYPGFDLRAETQNPQFQALLRTGTTSVRDAYEMVHHQELAQLQAQAAAKTAEKRVVDGIRARGARPQENGTSSQSGFVVKDDVSKLSSQDVKEIMRRVAAGEKISFG